MRESIPCSPPVPAPGGHPGWQCHPVPAVPPPRLLVLPPLSPKLHPSPPGGPQVLQTPRSLLQLQNPGLGGIPRGFSLIFNSGVSRWLLGARDRTRELDLVTLSLLWGQRELGNVELCLPRHCGCDNAVNWKEI